MTSGRDLNVGQYFSLVRDLNAVTRFSVVAMRGHGNVAGADAVLTWQTGYPFAVSLAGGVPRYGPGEFTAVDMLARHEADAAMIVASDPMAHFPGAAAKALADIPTVVIDPTESLTASKADVYLPGAQYGADAEGTYYRMDGVPVRARAFLRRRRPTDEEIFDRLLKEVIA
jgi:formylmethanofuran dehydrogenase subunit B